MLRAHTQSLTVFALLISIANATFRFGVFTAHDVGMQQNKAVATDRGDYNIYAAISKFAINQDYYRNVLVMNADSSAFMSVYDIANSVPSINSLNPFKLTLATSSGQGLRIWDKNTVGPSMPYTLYIVRQNTNYDVYSAGRSQSTYITSPQGGSESTVIVISAEPYMTMSNFSLVQGGEIEIFTTARYDIGNTRRVFRMLDRSAGNNSYCTVMGPIATLYNPHSSNNKFTFLISSSSMLTNFTSIRAPAVISVSSPGYSQMSASFNYDYVNFYPQIQQFDMLYPSDVTMYMTGAFTPEYKMTVDFIGGNPETYIFNAKNSVSREKKLVTQVRFSLSRPAPIPNHYIELRVV